MNYSGLSSSSEYYLPYITIYSFETLIFMNKLYVYYGSKLNDILYHGNWNVHNYMRNINWKRVSLKSINVHIIRYYIMDSSPILTKWSMNFFDDIPLVKGSIIINLVLTGSMTTFFYLTRSRMAKYLMLICLLQFLLLSFLARKIAVELLHYNLNGL